MKVPVEENWGLAVSLQCLRNTGWVCPSRGHYHSPGIKYDSGFTEQIKGTVEIDRWEGTQFILRFPLEANKIGVHKKDHFVEEGIAEKDEVVDNPDEGGPITMKDVDATKVQRMQ